MTAFDFSEITKLAADLGKLDRPTREGARAAVEVSARRIKDAWNGKLYRDGHAKHTGTSISYDLDESGYGFGLLAQSRFEVGSSTVSAEIGPKLNSGKQAFLVRMLENGTVHNAPFGYGSAALHEHEADFEYGIARAIADAERGAGL